MSTQENKVTIRRIIEEGWNEGNVAVLDELCAPNLVFHNPSVPDVRTLADYKRFLTETRNAFPDFHVTIEDMIAEGDQVAVRYTLRGTNTGDIVRPMHIPATGKQFTMTGSGIGRFAGGKEVEAWEQDDYLGGFQQLGLIPSMG